MKEYIFETCCINADGEDIQNMTETAKMITYKTFIKHVDYKVIDEMFYKFLVRNDWHVTYHKGFYKEKSCYFLTHSGIEYIFVKYISED